MATPDDPASAFASAFLNDVLDEIDPAPAEVATPPVVAPESGEPQALFTHEADRPLNPASVMKLVTTYAALDLLGRAMGEIP